MNMNTYLNSQTKVATTLYTAQTCSFHKHVSWVCKILSRNLKPQQYILDNRRQRVI